MLTSMVIQHNKSKMRNAPIKQLGFFKCVLNPKKTTTYVHVRMPNMCLLTFSFHMVMDRPRVQRVASLGRCYVTYFDPWPLTQRSPKHSSLSVKKRFVCLLWWKQPLWENTESSTPCNVTIQEHHLPAYRNLRHVNASRATHHVSCFIKVKQWCNWCKRELCVNYGLDITTGN